MNKEQIEARLAELEQLADNKRAEINQAHADLNAIMGAKQDCDFWLQKIMLASNEEIVPATTVPETPAHIEAPAEFTPMQETAPQSEV